MNLLKRFSAVVWLSLLLTGVAHAAEPINTFGPGGSFFSDPKRTGVAIRGYDTVAYFKDSKPVPGKDEFVTEWMGAKWKFASQEHLDLFKADPTKYAPQYGGYCAYGIAKDNVVKIEPDQWTIADGKLYLNYDADIQKKWKGDQAGYIKQADGKFSTLIKK
ncbi:MAG: YHS domain-containing protein [Nevskia sp.]|nr:YHS domain-containing protein [Nevskia sp.]MCK9383809.1 YHS domain-containing protein [Nevskia sp.]